MRTSITCYVVLRILVLCLPAAAEKCREFYAVEVERKTRASPPVRET